MRMRLWSDSGDLAALFELPSHLGEVNNRRCSPGVFRRGLLPTCLSRQIFYRRGASVWPIPNIALPLLARSTIIPLWSFCTVFSDLNRITGAWVSTIFHFVKSRVYYWQLEGFSLKTYNGRYMSWWAESPASKDNITKAVQDLRNHGDSPHDTVHNYITMADDVEEFMQDHGLKRVILIGHSMWVHMIL